MTKRATLAGLCGLAIAAGLPGSAFALDACPDQPQAKVLYSGSGKLESVGVDRKGRIFFTDLDAGSLLRLRDDGTVRTLLSGIDGPGGIVFKRHSLLVGFGNGSQAADGPVNPEGGLLQVDPRTGKATTFVDGLQMANGIARGPGGQIFASNALLTGIDRVQDGSVVELGWANIPSPNGLAVSADGKFLYASQTLSAAGIQRIPIADPSAASQWYSAPLADATAGLDGLERGPDGNLYVAANAGGAIWRVSGPGHACSLVARDPFPKGPSDIAFTRGRGFPDGTMIATTWGGELLAIPGAAETSR